MNIWVLLSLVIKFLVLYGSVLPVFIELVYFCASSNVLLGSFKAIVGSLEGSPPRIKSTVLIFFTKGSSYPKSSSLTWKNKEGSTRIKSKNSDSKRKMSEQEV